MTTPASHDPSLYLYPKTHSPFYYCPACRQTSHPAFHPARAQTPRSSDYTPPLTEYRYHTSAQAHPAPRLAAPPSQGRAIAAAYFFRRIQVLVRSLSVTPSHYPHTSTYPPLTTLYFDSDAAHYTHVSAAQSALSHSHRSACPYFQAPACPGAGTACANS